MLDNTMSDEPTEHDSREYENSIIDAHKNNPPRIGERVAVYNWGNDELIGVGERIESWWSGFYYQHMSRVRLDNGQEVTALMESQCRPVSPEEIRKTFKSV